MDTQNTQSGKIYTKGFNTGYLLAQHEPWLLDKLLTSDHKKHEFFQGLEHGKDQFHREKFIAQMKQAQEKGKDREREGR